jgi:hypothetical protein
MHKYAIGVPNLSIATESDNCPICLKAKLHEANKSTFLFARLLDAIKVILSTFALSCNLPKLASVFVTSAACMAIRVTYSCIIIPATRSLTRWLATRGAGPTVVSKDRPMDLGGQLGRYQEVLDLFTHAG